MEQKIRTLFDLQRFCGNPRLNGIVADVEGRYAAALSDDELALVSAAGDAAPVLPRPTDPEADALQVLTSGAGKEEQP